MVAAGYAVPACRGAALACPARRPSRRAPRRAAPVGATSGDASDSSDRVSTLQNEGAYAVLAKATALEREGRDIVHLEIGQPGFATPTHIVEAGVDAIRGGKTKYAAPDGAPSLREAIAAHVSETRGVAVSPDEVVVGPGAKPGLFFPTLALVNPGDTVVYPDPGFPTYRAMIEVAGGIPAPAPLRPDGASFDMAALADLVRSRKPRLIVLNSPANPTGGVMPREDVEAVARLAEEHGAWILSDEIYSRLVYADGDADGDADDAPSTYAKEKKAFSAFSVPGARARTVLVDGFSKTYCMTGWRLGWAVMPAHLARKVELLAVHSYGCVAAFTQEAGVAALTGPQDDHAEMLVEYRRRRDFVVAALNEIEGVKCPVPQGAFYAFPDVGAFGKTSAEIADGLLRDAGVAVLPGTDFGANGEGKIRLSYVGEMATLEEGMRRIKAYFDGL
jgi:aspartate/methionine/tyrosine aminotransferase